MKPTITKPPIDDETIEELLEDLDMNSLGMSDIETLKEIVDGYQMSMAAAKMALAYWKASYNLRHTYVLGFAQPGNIPVIATVYDYDEKRQVIDINKIKLHPKNIEEGKKMVEDMNGRMKRIDAQKATF